MLVSDVSTLICLALALLSMMWDQSIMASSLVEESSWAENWNRESQGPRIGCLQRHDISDLLPATRLHILLDHSTMSLPRNQSIHKVKAHMTQSPLKTPPLNTATLRIKALIHESPGDTAHSHPLLAKYLNHIIPILSRDPERRVLQQRPWKEGAPTFLCRNEDEKPELSSWQT